jgi:hypothetical protein
MRIREKKLLILALGIVAASLVAIGRLAGREPGGETYYMVVYGAQTDGFSPNTSHCFASFARFVHGTRAEPVVELRHINWYSVRGHMTGSTRGLIEEDGRPVRPEPGQNRTTRDALLLAARGGLRVTRWGPYEIDRGLYERALRQIARLERRMPGPPVLYKELDRGYREEQIVATNCIHAISDVDRDGGPLRSGTDYGERAARRVVVHLARWIKHSGRDHSEVWAHIWRETWRPEPAPEPRRVLEWVPREIDAGAWAGNPRPGIPGGGP